MADNDTPMENVPVSEMVFHDDPGINTPLVRLETTVREYLAAHAAQTGQSKDKLFEEWKAGLAKADSANLPDMEDVNEWVWNDATASELIAFMEYAKNLVSDIGFVIQRYYVGGKSNATKDRPMESLTDHRKRVVKSILNLMELCESDIFPGLTVEMIRNLPSVDFEPRKDKDGKILTGDAEGEYIKLPRAPKSPSDKPKTNADGPKPKRANNTKTFIMVNGELYIPKGDDKRLGGACTEVFHKTVQECGKEYFNNWLDDNNPALYTAPDGTVYGLKTVD